MMTLLTQKFSKLVSAGAIRLVTLVLFLAALGSFAYVANAGAAPDDQVSFTATGTAVLTALTKLPGGLTQLDFSVSGKATHLGDFTGQGTRIQDKRNFVTNSVFVGANGKDSVFISIGGQFETSKDKCVITSTGTFTVTGGTGAFANATGSGTTFTRIDLCADTTTGAYTGTISRPNSN